MSIKTRTSGIIVDINVEPAAAAGYQGPGDVVSNAFVWYGLRAYTAASIGANCVKLRENGTDTTQIFATIAGGGLDLTAIDAFRTSQGGTQLFVDTLYDQAGGGIDLLQATTTKQPEFLLSGLGSLPVIVGASGKVLVTGVGSLVISQPLTFSLVANSTQTTGSQQNIITDATDQSPTLFTNQNNNQVGVYAGGVFNQFATAADGSWHAFQGVVNGASSDMNVDGTSNTGGGDIGADGFNAASALALGGLNSTPTNPFVGKLVECGIWSIAFSGGQSTSMKNNQSAYWGY